MFAVSGVCMFKIRLLLFLSLFLLTVDAYAARGFYIADAEVESVSVFYDGSLHVLQMEFRADPLKVDTTKVTCASTWISGGNGLMVVSWWSENAPSNFIMGYASLATAAQAQNKKVDISIATDKCGVSKPYGQFWSGIRVVK